MLKTLVSITMILFIGSSIVFSQVDSTAVAELRKTIGFLKTKTDISVEKHETTDVVFDDTLKFEFNSTCLVKVNDNNEFSIENTGDFGEKSYTLSDGVFTFYNKDNGFYSNIATKGSISEVINFCSQTLGLQIPLADFMTPVSFEKLLDNLEAAIDLGETTIMGQKVRHLAFVSPNFSWQIWVSVEGDPVPVKYTICEIHEVGMPTYSAYFTNWSFKKIKPIETPQIDAEDVLIEFNLAKKE